MFGIPFNQNPRRNRQGRGLQTLAFFSDSDFFGGSNWTEYLTRCFLLVSEPMIVSLLTHICVTRPQCLNHDRLHVFRPIQNFLKMLEMQVFINFCLIRYGYQSNLFNQVKLITMIFFWSCLGIYCSSSILLFIFHFQLEHHFLHFSLVFSLSYLSSQFFFS